MFFHIYEVFTWGQKNYGLVSTTNPVSFWTRKSKYAWNVQAMRDANRDFLYVSVICPESTHDSHAWGLGFRHLFIISFITVSPKET
jgi:hypothetical protein